LFISQLQVCAFLRIEDFWLVEKHGKSFGQIMTWEFGYFGYLEFLLHHVVVLKILSNRKMTLLLYLNRTFSANDV